MHYFVGCGFYCGASVDYSFADWSCFVFGPVVDTYFVCPDPSFFYCYGRCSGYCVGLGTVRMFACGSFCGWGVEDCGYYWFIVYIGDIDCWYVWYCSWYCAGRSDSSVVGLWIALRWDSLVPDDVLGDFRGGSCDVCVACVDEFGYCVGMGSFW